MSVTRPCDDVLPTMQPATGFMSGMTMTLERPRQSPSMCLQVSDQCLVGVWHRIGSHSDVGYVGLTCLQ